VTHEFVASEDRPAVSYGPNHPTQPGEWVLSISCEEERVEISLGEQPMYDLWVEVRGVPYPEPSPIEVDRGRKNRLVRQLVHAANDADEGMLEDALEALGVRR
jgi:hypothetical protein